MQYIKRLKPMVLPLQNSTANTIYVDSDDNTIKVGTGASGSTERTLHESSLPALFADGTAAAPSIAFASQPGLGFYLSGTNLINLSNGTEPRVTYAAGATDTFAFGSGTAFAWSSSTTSTGAADLILKRQGAGYLFQRNGTNAQREAWANTYTSATNFESFDIDWQTQANVALVGTRTAATGTTRRLFLGSQSSSGANSYSGVSILQAGAPNVRIGIYSADGTNPASTTAIGEFLRLGEFTSTAIGGSVTPVAITTTYNQASGDAANTDLLINRTETAIGTGTQRLLDAQVGGVSKFNVDRFGTVGATGDILTQGGMFGMQNSSSTTYGNANTYQIKTKAVTGIANNTATDVLTVTVPNAAHSATVRVTLSGSLGAGGAIGANEATGSISYNFAVSRTAGVAAVVTASSAYGSSTASVAGAATITITAAASAIAGAVGATNTFTIQATIARGSGSSTNHTCRVTAEVINANSSGITVS